MKSRKTILATAVTGLLATQAALGLGLGEIKQNSALNEPMDAEVKILGLGDLSELELLVDLGSRTEFQNAGVEREFLLTQLNFSIDLDDRQNPVIRITSKQPIKEPYLDFLMEVQWPSGRLLREYTVLLDLPVFTESSQVKSVEAASTRSQSLTPSNSRSTRSNSQRNVSRAPTLAGGEEYRVSSGDSLWGIAKRARPEGGSIHQTMAAIHQLNTSAFINGDINLLKSGHVLRLPQGSDINEADSGEVVSQLAADTSTYAAPAVTDSQDEPTDILLDATSQQSSTDKSSAGVADGRLKLTTLDLNDRASGANAAGGENGSSANEVRQNEFAIVEEELDKTQRENTELRERLGSLEQQIETMRRLVELNDPTLTALQNRDVEGLEDDQDTTTGSLDDSALAELELAGSTEIDAALAEDSLTEGALTESAESQAAEDVALEDDATPIAPASVSSNTAESGWKYWLDLLMYPLVGLIAILLAVFLFFRNKPEDEDEFLRDRDLVVDEKGESEEIDEDALTAEDLVVAAEMGETITEDDLSGLELDDDEGLDPVGEADIYLSLGNYRQAEDVLKESLVADPDNSELHLKLLEVYVASHNTDKFDEQFNLLNELGNDEIRGKAQKLKEEFLSDEELSLDDIADDKDGEQGGITEFDLTDIASEDLDSDDLTDLLNEPSLMSGGEKLEEPSFEGGELEGGELEATELEGVDASDLAALDDLLGDHEDPQDTEVSETKETGLEEINASDDLDFDLELELDDLDMESLSGDIDKLSLETKNDLEVELTPGLDGEQNLEDIGDLDFDLEEGTDLDGVDLEDIGLDSQESEVQDEVLAEAEKTLAELDDLDIADSSDNGEIEAVVEQTESGSSEASEEALEPFDTDLDADLDLLSEADECSTKLDLAEAFLEMGDQDGAKEILDEVIAEGSAEQQDKARSLLGSI